MKEGEKEKTPEGSAEACLVLCFHHQKAQGKFSFYLISYSLMDQIEDVGRERILIPVYYIRNTQIALICRDILLVFFHTS